MWGWLGRPFLRNKPVVVPTIIRRFTTADPTITPNLAIDGDAWFIDSKEPQVIRLFAVTDPDVAQATLVYRATMKSENFAGRFLLELWYRLPGGAEYYVHGADQAVSGTTEWAPYELSVKLGKNCPSPELIKLNVLVEGFGRVWIRDVELLSLR